MRKIIFLISLFLSQSLLALDWSHKCTVQKVCVNSINHSSMTIARAALGALKPLDAPETKEASDLFYNLWKENQVVLDSWFAFEASRPNKEGINIIDKLLSSRSQPMQLQYETIKIFNYI